MSKTTSLKKCIVLDLDNTLWGGIIGENGMQGIALSLSPPGNSFIAFQQALRDHYDRGIILAINSRNNESDALQVIRTHPNMILKENHFAAMRINWNNKVQNLKELAQELNIGLDSMIFLDDDPTNRAEVRGLLPEVTTPDLPEYPRDYVKFLNSLKYFDDGTITDEDKMRGNLYVTERLRKEEEKIFTNREEFLKNLGLELSIYKDNDSNLSRLSQLTEKTNQFNTLKRHLSESEIAEYMNNPNHSVFYARLTDKFGDHGIIAFALIDKKRDEWHIRSLLMSCRVFDRGVEYAFLGTIIKEATRQGVKKITIAFQSTEKNSPALNFIEKHFDQDQYDPQRKIEIPSWINIIYGKI